MLRYKFEARLRGLIAFSVLAVMGALVSGISAQQTPSTICTVSDSIPSKVMVWSAREEPARIPGRQITVVHVVPGYPIPEPPAAPIPPQPLTVTVL